MQDENLGIHQFGDIILINQHILRSMIKEAISRKEESACDKTKRGSGYSLEFCLLA